MHKSKLIAIATGMMILGCAGFGLITKNSFQDGFSGSNFDNFSYTAYEKPKIDMQDIFDHLDPSTLIARVRATPTPTSLRTSRGPRGQQQQAYLCTRSTAEVLQVYKGNLALEHTTINLYEAAYFGPYVHDCRNFIYFNLMQPEQEYIVFLYEKKYLPTYQNLLPCPEFRALGEFAILPLDTTVHTYVQERKSIRYQDLQNERILVTSEEEYQQIVQAIRDIFDHYDVVWE